MDPLFFLTLSYGRPWVFYLLPVIWFFLALLLRWNLFRPKDLTIQEATTRKRRLFWSRWGIFFSRAIVCSLILIALADPYVERSIAVEGNPRVKVLFDTSASMSLFDAEPADSLVADLKARVLVETFTFGSEKQSEIGDAILSHMESNVPMLIITDGQVTKGADLASVAQFAVDINSSLSILELPVSKTDAYVTILGPSKTLEDIENEYHVQVQASAPLAFTVVVEVDGKQVFSEAFDGLFAEFSIPATFKEGSHTIVARLQAQDAFSQNNLFWKTIHVVDKPKVLVIAKSRSSTITLLEEIYDVTVANGLPKDMSPYTAVVLQDVPAASFSQEDIVRLGEHVVDGNGLVALGGMNSFDLGEYENSLLEGILPVQVGSGEQKESDTYVVLLIDISKSTKGGARGDKSKYSVSDVIKAQAIAMLNTLDPEDHVGVVAFNDRAYMVSPIGTLKDNKAQIIDNIARLQFANTTYMNVGLMASYQLLREVSGGKNIVVLSDGKVSGTSSQDTLDLGRKLSEGNIHVYTVGVGAGTDREFLKQLARVGDGVYFEPSEYQKLKILFGSPDLLKTEGLSSLIVLNSDHFITQDLVLDAKFGAYNSVVPKREALSLLTLESGEPALTVWQHGLGRVATINVFTTNGDLGSLTNKANSRAISRMMNWAIGDPQRNAPYFVDVPDTFVDMVSYARVRSEKVPQAQGVAFYQDASGEYVSSFVPKEQGIFELLATSYAVNAPMEFAQVGVSEALLDAVSISGGEVFKPQETQRIIEFLKAKSTRIQIEKINYARGLLLLALALFVFEVCVRRILEMWRR